MGGAMAGTPAPRQRGAQRRIVRRQINVAPVRGHFRGQLPGEQLIWFQRRHWLFLFVPAWPVVLSLIVFAFVNRLLGATPGLAQFLQLIFALLIVALMIRWILNDLSNWLFQYYILTDQRVITSRGYFRPTREEVVLKNVAQVMVDRTNPLVMALGIGTVVVRPIGTPLRLDNVARPRAVADSILAVQEGLSVLSRQPMQVAASAQSTSQHQGPGQQQLQATLDAIAQPIQPPVPPPPVRGRIPFGGMFQRKIPIKLMEKESVLEIVYRHWFVLLRRELVSAILLVASVEVGVSLRTFGGPPQERLALILAVSGVAISLIWAVLVYLNYADDIFVLTTHRVIDIDRVIFILTEYSTDAPYSRVQDIHVEQSFIGNLLRFGTIVVETSGRKYPVKMSDVPHALALMDRVFKYINDAKERENITATNRQKSQSSQWLSQLLDTLMVEAPDVRGLPLLDATAQTRTAGLKLVVAVERPAPGTAPGIVLDQIPTAGTTTLPGGELRVALSGQSANTSVTP